MDTTTMEEYYDANDGFGLMYAYLQDTLSDDDKYALDVVTDILGMTTDAIDDFLYAVFGYDFEQYHDEEEQYRR